MDFEEAISHLKKRVKYDEVVNGNSNCAIKDKEAIDTIINYYEELKEELYNILDEELRNEGVDIQ